MADGPTSSSRVPIGSLIAIPALITLAVTILRLAGELQHWSNAYFNPEPGGGNALVGITWLAPLFGIYFALKLERAGHGPPSHARAVSYAVLAAVIVVLGAAYAPRPPRFSFKDEILYLWVLLALGALVTGRGWRALAKVLLAYGYAARIPVLIIMFLAMKNHWGTHYDAAPPNVAFSGFWSEFLWLGFFPQLVYWVAFTIVSGMLFGSIAELIRFVRASKQE